MLRLNKYTRDEIVKLVREVGYDAGKNACPTMTTAILGTMKGEDDKPKELVPYMLGTQEAIKWDVALCVVRYSQSQGRMILSCNDMIDPGHQTEFKEEFFEAAIEGAKSRLQLLESYNS